MMGSSFRVSRARVAGAVRAFGLSGLGVSIVNRSPAFEPEDVAAWVTAVRCYLEDELIGWCTVDSRGGNVYLRRIVPAKVESARG